MRHLENTGLLILSGFFFLFFRNQMKRLSALSF